VDSACARFDDYASRSSYAALVDQGRFSVPRLSIIIPVLGSAARLETTLVSVLEKRPADCEIVVVLNAAYDDPYDLDGEVRFVQVPAKMGLVESVNEGIQASASPIVHVLASGVEVAEGWTDAVLAHFKDPRIASVAPRIANVLDPRVTLAAGLEYSCRRGRVVRNGAKEHNSADVQEVLGTPLQAAFYRRSALELVGGLPRAVGDDVADVDLALTFKYAGYKCLFDSRSTVLAMPGDLASPPVGFRSGLARERLFWRVAPVVGWCKSIAAHPAGVVGDFASALPGLGAVSGLFGRLIACLQMRSHRAHHQWLIDVERAAGALLRVTRPQQLRIDGPHTTFQSAESNLPRISAPSTART
jgi:hypothetical protein